MSLKQNYLQAEDRTHRIGQEREVRVIYLVARKTIDELMWPLIKRKLDVLNKAGLSKDTYKNTGNPLYQREDQMMMDEFIQKLDRNTIQETFGQF